MPQSNGVAKISSDLKRTKLLEGVIVFGMTVKQAAYYAGFSPGHASSLLKEPAMIEEAEAMRAQMEAKYNITRDRVVRGMVDAIDRAKNFGDPKTEIAGWKELGKMHGHYAPSEHRIHVSRDAERLERELRTLPYEEVLKLATSGGNWHGEEALEGEFTEVKRDD
jgi:hypothetical protein